MHLLFDKWGLANQLFAADLKLLLDLSYLELNCISYLRNIEIYKTKSHILEQFFAIAITSISKQLIGGNYFRFQKF